VEYDTRYRTSKSNPVEHTEAHIGKYYIVEDAEGSSDKVFGTLDEEFAVVGEKGMMIRPAGLQLVSKLEDIKAGTASGDADSNAFTLLMGPRGRGKSGVLSYALQYARANGWLALVGPDAQALLQDGLVITPSRVRPGKYDQHDVALEVLRSFRAAHAEQLGSLPQRGKHGRDRYLPSDIDAGVWEEKEALIASEAEAKRRLRAQKEAAGEEWDPSTFQSAIDYSYDPSQDRSDFTLLHMCEWAEAHPAYATDALVDLLWELRQVTEFPVMLLLDDVNVWWEETAYPVKGNMLKPEDLTLVDAMRPLDAEGVRTDAIGFARGTVVAATTHAHTRHPREMREDSTLPPACMLPVDRMTRREVWAQLLHYQTAARFYMLPPTKPVDAHTVEYYRTLTDANPREVFNAALFH
jgi:hypothetical protein